MDVSETSTEDGDRPASRTFRFAMSFFSVLLVATIASQFTGLFGNSPLNTVWPQAWTFFRTASTASLIVAYRVGADGALTLLTEREATGGELWGLRRGIYAQQGETALLSAAVPEGRWFDCAPGNLGCADEIAAAEPVPAVNTAGAPSLCGHIALMRVRPGPLKLGDPAGLRDTLIRGTALDVTCERG
ncbi:hypothetical protein Afil01_42230 [Actinorhabdospora filicis]|uniref:Uncharacterized protein n=1 Tax=Actinorhabdospora filicis TaxID=1785913 RepID=A0A9W6WBC0_9ACTN|nr:hypothetical protein [Actinorhabdospora filicis]GLZ79416.1 hypothetical protein Afil01_42230 [Actinorhabdospora filicis]